MLPKIKIWNKTRHRHLDQRWKENPEHQSLSFWKRYFEFVKESKFLTGQIPSRNGELPFLADLEWLIKANNFAKVIEEKFHRENPYDKN